LKRVTSNNNLIDGIVKSVLVIDDAFAPAKITDITEDDIGRLSSELSNRLEYVDELSRLLSLGSDFDPLRPADINRIAQVQSSLDILWPIACSNRNHWLNETLFFHYRSVVQRPREEELNGLQEVLSKLSCRVSTYFELDTNYVDIKASQIIFFDFFLKGELKSEPALERARKLGEAIQRERISGALEEYPLIILMSSREGAEQNAEEFKRLTGLRGDFFRFIRKDEAQDKLDDDFSGLLRHYSQNQKLAKLLDEYWISALRASELLRESIARVEPTELALLEEAELGVEQEKLPEYLSWLVSEYLGSFLLADEGLHAKSADIPAALAHVAFPGIVAPTSALTEMFIRSTMRIDINDGSELTKKLAVTLGDVFARFEAGNSDPVEFYLVVDQTCDLARPAKKTRVLCLVSEAVRLTDIARAFYRSETQDPAADIVPIDVVGERRHYLAVWDLLNPKSVDLKDLTSRAHSIQRVARFKPVRALARQEQLTQKLGRIGEEVVPPHYIAYRAKLILNHKSKGSAESAIWEFDALKQEWPSVIMVHGRHKLYNDGDPANGVDENGAPIVSGDDKKASARLSFTDKFTAFLKERIAATIFPAEVKSRMATLLQKLSANEFQRLDISDYGPADSKQRAKGSGREVCKTKEKPVLVIAFDAVPEKTRADENILLLTTYKPT